MVGHGGRIERDLKADSSEESMVVLREPQRPAHADSDKVSKRQCLKIYCYVICAILEQTIACRLGSRRQIPSSLLCSKK